MLLATFNVIGVVRANTARCGSGCMDASPAVTSLGRCWTWQPTPPAPIDPTTSGTASASQGHSQDALQLSSQHEYAAKHHRTNNGLTMRVDVCFLDYLCSIMSENIFGHTPVLNWRIQITWYGANQLGFLVMTSLSSCFNHKIAFKWFVAQRSRLTWIFQCGLLTNGSKLHKFVSYYIPNVFLNTHHVKIPNFIIIINYVHANIAFA